MTKMYTEHAQLANVKLQTISQTREGGDIAASDKFWILTFRVPANSIDANELPAMAAAPVFLTFEPTQLALNLEHKPTRAPKSGSRRSGKEAAAGEAEDKDND